MEVYHAEDGFSGLEAHLPRVLPAPAERRCRVSVVIPLYNKRTSISRAVRSVLEQTFEDLELIVVDDGSDDGSNEVLAFIRDDRMRVVRQPNQGVSVARNRGILEARGEFVAFLDADDEWEENFLEVLLDVFERYPEVSVAGASYRVQGAEESREPCAPLFAGGQQDVVVDFFEAARRCQPLHASSSLMRREIFATTALFMPGIAHGEDLDMWMRVGLASSAKGLALTRRTHATWRTDAENRACQRRGETERLPSADRVLARAARYPDSVREYAYFILVSQARRLRLCGHRFRSLLWLWEARHTRWHWRMVLKEVAKVFLDRRTLPA